MRAPKKVIAAMAMATLIGGTVAPAFAADFEHSTGDVNGQGMQKAIKQIKDDESTKLATGDIEINGTFTKTVTNLPTVKEAGEYLRITMPLTLNYNYDLNTNVMNSVEGTIVNASVKATAKGDAGTEFDLKNQPVKMNFVGIENKNNSVEYVSTISEDNPQKAQLPFKLVVRKSNGQVLRNINLSDLVKGESGQSKKQIAPLTIEPENNISLKIEQIDNQKVKNAEQLKDGQTVSSPLTLKFEYAGE